MDGQEEQINDSTGKIDELNNILSITQQRLNKFKVCLKFSVQLNHINFDFYFRELVEV